jgi:hypothetical protein
LGTVSNTYTQKKYNFTWAKGTLLIMDMSSKKYRDKIKAENGPRYQKHLQNARASGNKRYQANKDNPEFKEYQKKIAKDWYEKKKIDPAFVAKRREAARLHYHKTKKLKGDQPNNE